MREQDIKKYHSYISNEAEAGLEGTREGGMRTCVFIWMNITLTTN